MVSKMTKRDIGRNVEETYKSFKKIKDFVASADTIETIQSFLEYSVTVRTENVYDSRGNKEWAEQEALENITQAYNNIMKKYTKAKK